MLPNPSYTLFMLLSLAVFLIARRLQPRTPGLDRLGRRERTLLALAAFIGGVFAAKLPFVNTDADWLTALWLRDGKTLTTGLVGAYLGVEIAKLALGIRVKTGDSFALPLAIALTVGRWGCFCNGCCFGQPTDLPWSVEFEGVARHPTQIYESGFHLAMAMVLCQLLRGAWLRTHRLQLYLIAYCAYRFVTEWIRPEPAAFLGLTFYQGVTVVFAAALIGQWVWETCRAENSAAARSLVVSN